LAHVMFYLLKAAGFGERKGRSPCS